MAEHKHTPAPWHVAGYVSELTPASWLSNWTGGQRHRAIRAEDGSPIALVSPRCAAVPYDWPGTAPDTETVTVEYEANIRLIETSPRILAALKMYVALDDRALNGHIVHQAQREHCWETAMLVIADATGKELT